MKWTQSCCKHAVRLPVVRKSCNLFSEPETEGRSVPLALLCIAEYSASISSKQADMNCSIASNFNKEIKIKLEVYQHPCYCLWWQKLFFKVHLLYKELRLLTRCYCCSQRSCLPWALPDLHGVAPCAQIWERSLQKIRRTVTPLLFLTESGPYWALEAKLSSLHS